MIKEMINKDLGDSKKLFILKKSGFEVLSYIENLTSN